MAIAEVTAAQKAYKTWQALHKVNLQVYGDEQLFCIGYEMRDDLIREMEELIDILVNRLTESKKPIVKKEPKNDKRKPKA